MQFDEVLADQCRMELKFLLEKSPILKDTWTASEEGNRRFMSYKCVDIDKEGVKWATLDTHVDTLKRLLINLPALCTQELHELTAEVAISGAIEDSHLEPDAESVKGQAYEFRAMLAHLRKTRREELRRGKRSAGKWQRVYELASMMSKLPPKQKLDMNKPTPTTQAGCSKTPPKQSSIPARRPTRASLYLPPKQVRKPY